MRSFIDLSIIGAACFAASVLLAGGQGMPGIFVRTQTPSGESVRGATVRIEGSGGSVAETTTDAEGKAAIRGVVGGQYVISAGKEGFERSTQVLIIQDTRQEIDLDFILTAKVSRTDSVDVIANVDAVESTTASSSATELRSAEVTSMPIRSATVADTLPLAPGVNRGANGEIQISGQGEQRSALTVNASDVTDPASGRFGATVPVGSVEVVDVFATPFLPEYGNFTSGIVTVQTKRGGETWHRSFRDPLPDFRVRSGHIRGLRDATPKFSIGGPLVHNRLFVSQSADYSLEKKQVRTLSFPQNEAKVESVNSFTQFDYIQSANHFVTGTVHVSPQHSNFVDPQFFNPQPVSPSSRGLQRSWTVIDHSSGAAGQLESSFSHQTYNTRIGSQGPADMVLTPIGNTGNYFANKNRASSRIEWLETFSAQVQPAHAVKVGSMFARTSNGGSFSFRPVEIRDLYGQLQQRIEFTSGSPFHESDIEHAVFIQDHWRPALQLGFDGGIRLEHQTKSSTWRMAPRIGVLWTPAGGANLVIRGGFGVFYDRVPLSVYAFPHYPEQIVTTYDASGGITGIPQNLLNIVETQTGKRFGMVKSRGVTGNFAPFSKTWRVEVERTISKAVHVRIGYQDNRSGGGILIEPKMSNGLAALVLNGEGSSRYRQVELTVRLSWHEQQQLMFSYVRSRSRGDLNAFNQYVADIPSIPIRPDVFSNLPSDIPDRFISWGFVNLPWKLRVAPIVEYRTGTPYAVIDAARNYVGIPYDDRTRLHNFLSTDVRISKDVKMLLKYKARISVSGLNLTNHFNSLDVHANVADPQFGTLFGHYKRRYRADFEVLF